MSVCNWWQWTCKLRLPVPGKMTVKGVVSGMQKSKELTIGMSPVVLKVTPPTHFGKVGQTAPFAATITPTQRSDGSAIPWSVTNWRFKLVAPLPNGWSSGFSCAGQVTCNFGPFATPDHLATVTVFATVNSVPDSANATVIVAPCPTDNFPIDDPAVRQQLKAQQDTSVADGKERGGWIFYNPETGRYTTETDLDATRSDCEHKFSRAVPLTPGSPWIPVGLYHTHNRAPNDVLTCPTKNGRRARNGPSPEDVKSVDSAGYPMYVVDGNEVWFISFPQRKVSPAWKYRGPGAACAW